MGLNNVRISISRVWGEIFLRKSVASGFLWLELLLEEEEEEEDADGC